MKRIITAVVAAIGSALLLSSCVTRTVTTYEPAGEGGMASGASAAEWPELFSSGQDTFTIYQPRCDSWNGHEFEGRSAVAVDSAAQSQPLYGVVSFSAITLVDKSTQTATLADIKIKHLDFPAASAPPPDYIVSLRQEFPRQPMSLSLSTLEPSLTAIQQPPATGPLDNSPPNVIIANRPAMLVTVDGPPAWRAVPGTSLDRAINTRALLLKDQSGQYYLHLFDGYVQAPSINGPWTAAARRPAGADTAESLVANLPQTDLLRGETDPNTQQMPSLKSSPVPEVIVATQPSELITFNGQPDYMAIPGTQLLYASNTSGNVFKSLRDQQEYILISGRWYKGASLNGPWTFVPANALPRDFAGIPDDSPKENVKASVPGTPQAREALVANSIPQSTAVPRTTQMQTPQFDGSLQVAPINGTSLHYVVNSGTPIIEVNPDSWYACENGVWYAGPSASGPWAVADSVPPVIYTIPPSSPLYYVTSVQVYGSTPDEVYEGYTPGYFGTVVEPDGTVVYGTGYDYDPWIGSDWYVPPFTWGWGFDDCWTPWWGWGFGCGFGWGWGFGGFGWWGCHPPFPWWGGFRDWHDFDHDRAWWRDRDAHGWAHTGADIYNHGGAFAGNRFNASGHEGWSGGFGHAYNSRSGQIAAGETARIQTVSGSAWRPGSARASLRIGLPALREYLAPADSIQHRPIREAA